MIAEAMEKVGKEGVITVEEGKSLENELDVVEGMQFDRGYLSPYFINNQESMRPSSKSPTSSSTTRRSRTFARCCCRCSKPWPSPASPLLIIAEDVEGEALATLVVNNHPRHRQGRGRQGAGLRRSPQGHAPGHRHPDRRQVISEEVGLTLEKATLDDLGTAKKIQITKENTTIVDGAGDSDDIEGRVNQIRGRSRRPPATTTVRSCRSVSPSSPAVWPSSRSVRRPRSR